MSKFKVGDRVKLSAEGRAEFDNCSDNPYGMAGTIVSVYDCCEASLPLTVSWDNDESNTYAGRHLEPIPTRTLTVGETYTIGSGRKMRVIYIEGGVAFGVFLNPEGVPSLNSAYTWDMNGVYRNAVEDEKPQYNVKFEPVVEWVERHLNYDPTPYEDECVYTGHHDEGDNLILRFQLIDGKPDWSQATITPQPTN